jgi:valyl-tRNA synthetase
MSEIKQEIPKTYNPEGIEDKWYSFWMEKQLYHSLPDPAKKPYTIVIPPPNITGILTMGHILNNTIQDIYIRLKRMQGYNTCWVPGTDHASIATETKVTKALADQGVNKTDIGRDEFLKHCRVWKEKYGGIIIQQLKKLGVSCDWERERFTMDEDYYQQVIHTFVALYNEGKIYKGYRMVNWCPVSKSAISDEEVIPKSVNSNLWYFKYPIENSTSFLVVATTRPETMLGDTGVAVNPEDPRYADLIGKNVILPIVDRPIPIFADEYVDISFGTGAVKVTPAHDINDYAMGQRHNLEIINIFNEDASLNHNVPDEYKGLDRFAARKKVVAWFEDARLMEKIEPYMHNVGYSERGGVPIEPYLSEQWFMKMDDLARPAIEVVREGKVNFHPKHWVKTYEHWMNNISDWCISRQLWWGHRIPVWYCDDLKTENCSKPIVAESKPEGCPHCHGTNIHQDEDVLDTWASSWLWAHDVFRSEEEKKYYYPTDLLVTAPDIIFFWVARMIMAGLHFRKDIPFKDVYFTSIIRDLQGRKMSKSLGNSPDPLDVIKTYGADSLRFTTIYLAPLGQDVLFSEEKCELGRNFANKLWNAGRFLMMNLQEIPFDASLLDKHIDKIDEWIDSRFNSSLTEFNRAMDNFEINNGIKIMYAFVWNDFCDWYIELSKIKFYAEDKEIKSAALSRAILLFEKTLKMIHPFMPFITEELWHLIEARNENESISTSDFPAVHSVQINPVLESEIEFLQAIITSIRNIRAEMNIAPSKVIAILIKTDNLDLQYLDSIKKITRSEVVIDANLQKPAKSASAVLKDCEIFIPLEGIINLDVEKNRLQKDIQRLEGSLKGLRGKLSNEKFVQNAPAEVVEKERQKEADWQSQLAKLQELHSNLE